MIRAEVFGVGSGTFCGNKAISKAMADGMFWILFEKAILRILTSREQRAFMYRSNIPFLRTMALRGAAPVPVATLFLPRDLSGVAYGGGALERAASQSKGTDDDIEGVSAGDL